MVHYEGFIQIPEHQTIEFMVAADDGGTVSIAGAEFGTWNLKGCSWSAPADLSGLEGEQPLDGWFFEYGGGTCFMLAWKIDDEYWEIVPDWAYTTESTPSTTTSTTTVLETTVPATTTTSTTLQATTTTPSTSTTASTISTTTSSTSSTTTTTEPETTTTSSTSTSLVATSTTQGWVSPPPSATTEPSTTAPTTTTTEEPAPQTSEATVQSTPSTDLPVATTDSPSTTRPTEPATSVPVETATTQAESTTTLPDLLDGSNDPQFSEVEAEQARALVDEAINDGLTAEVVAALAADPAVIENVSVDQAAEIFEALNDASLTDAQVDAVTEVMNNAPDEIKEEFESAVNIFGKGFDNYVPLGSSISVGVRRVVIASSALLSAVPSVRAEGTSRRQRV